MHTHWDREVSQSVNLSLGLRWTGLHATLSQLKTSSTSATGLMPGMIMPPSPLISVFRSFLPSLALPPLLFVCLLVVAPSVYISGLLLQDRAAALCGWRLCVICRLRLDLFHVIPETKTTTRVLTASHASTLFMLLLAVALMFHTYFAEKGQLTTCLW